MSINRRTFLAGAAAVGLSSMVKPVFAQSDVIQIGVPTGVTGNWSALGAQVQRACRLFEKHTNAQGGIDGRPVSFVYEDTQGDPAACVRKVSELVEGRNIKFITGIISSGESLAVMPRLEAWDALYLATISGTGTLTGSNYVPNAFRTTVSGPMRARTIAHWLEKSDEKKFFTIAQDYAWGKSSLETFEGLLKKMNKESVGNVLTPLGTKDYSSYITRIRQANPEVLYVAMSGDDATAFLKQAGQYRLSERMQIVTEVLDLLNTRPLGDAGLGLTGVSQYNYSYDTPANVNFVRLFRAEYNDIPDTWEGSTWQSLMLLAEAIRRAKSTDTKAVRDTMEGLEMEGLQGKITMRACDHQLEQQVFIARIEKTADISYPTPRIIDAYPAKDVMPACRADS